MTGTPQNGPSGREWGQVLGELKAISANVERLDRDVRTSIKRADEAHSRADEAHARLALVKERIFALGALVAILSGLGGGVVNEHWAKIAMKETRYERPDTKSPEPVGLAFNHCGRRDCGRGVREHVPQRR